MPEVKEIEKIPWVSHDHVMKWGGQDYVELNDISLRKLSIGRFEVDDGGLGVTITIRHSGKKWVTRLATSASNKDERHGAELAINALWSTLVEASP